MLQGGMAYSSGKTLETTVIATLESKGFVTVPYKAWLLEPRKFGAELLLRNVPYTTLYGHEGKTEFLIHSARYQLDIRVECKWQQSAGSVDEKFPYLYLNCMECMPEKQIIILIDGGGAKSGAIQWLRTVAREQRYLTLASADKSISVMDLREFLVWANKTFR